MIVAWRLVAVVITRRARLRRSQRGGFGLPRARRASPARSRSRLSAVRWGVAGNIMAAWVLTFPGAGLAATAAYWVVAGLLGS